MINDWNVSISRATLVTLSHPVDYLKTLCLAVYICVPGISDGDNADLGMA